MAMAMRASATSIAATRCSGLRGLFSTLSSASPFSPPHTNQTESPKAEPSTSLFVYGLSKRTTAEGLREAFTKFGEVVDARVITDRVSGFSKGFGFVKYTTIEEATKGIKGMDGQSVPSLAWSTQIEALINDMENLDSGLGQIVKQFTVNLATSKH